MSEQPTTKSRASAKSLEKTSSAALLEQLGQFIDTESKTAAFACGGSIPIATSEDTVVQPEGKETTVHSSPVIIRWDSKGDAESRVSKLTLPLDATPSVTQAASEGDAATGFTYSEEKSATTATSQTSPESGAQALEQLIRDCQPATFGFKGKDILDDTYRKAIKLDETAFSANFNPYTLGIIDAIAQVLLPSVTGELRGVRTELYKLNIYSGPSGKFKAHVDTPRSEAQFGSLVVCLPCAHEGGALLVRHKGNTTTLDWSTSSGADAKSIHWAAFYSDCEHEVLEVVSGHRITLTYNLYVSRGAGLLAGHCLAMDATQLPLYGVIKELPSQPAFMKKGGILGIGCAHVYPHTSRAFIKELPGALKGIDMVVYEAFRTLGLEVRLRPIVKGIHFYDDYDDYDEFEDYEEYDTSDDSDDDGTPRASVNCVGARLYPFAKQACGEDTLGTLMEAGWRCTKEKIHWLRRCKGDEPALAYMAYGNESSLEVVYSNAALLVEVPRFSKRGEFP